MSDALLDRVPLTPIEKVFFRISEEFNGDCTCHVPVRLQGCIEAEPLSRALHALQLRHPKLRARLVKEENGEQFFEECSPPPPVPFEIVDHEAELPDVVEDPVFWHEGILKNEVVPLIRVKVHRNRAQSASILVVTIPHALGDGTSQAGVVKDLLAFYADATRTEGPVEAEILPAITVEKAKKLGTRRSRLGVLRNRLQFMREWRNGFVDLPAGRTASGLPRCHRWSWPAKESMALIQRCRREDTSIFGAVLAASLMALKETLDQPTVRATWRCPVDVRSQLEGSPRPLTNDDLGVYCVVFQQLYEVSAQDSFWGLARRARQDVKGFVDGGGPSLVYNLLARVTRPKETGGTFFKKLLVGVLRRYFRSKKVDTPTQEKRPTLQVSYVGFLEGSRPDDAIRILDWSMGLTSANVGPSLMAGGYMFGRQMQFAIFGFDLPDDFWEAYVASIKSNLLRSMEDSSE